MFSLKRITRKYEKYFDKFNNNELFPPFEIEWQLSSKCNINCKWCVGKVIRKNNNLNILKNDMNIKNAINIANNVVASNKAFLNKTGLKVRTIKFSGFLGETLVEKQSFIEATKIFLDNSINVGLFTNGIFLDDEVIEIAKDIKYVHISLDSGINSYKLIKGVSNSNYIKILSNILKLRKNKEKYKTNVDINIGYVIVPENIDDIFEVISGVKNAGAEMIRFKLDITDKNKLEDNYVFEILDNAIKKYQDDKFKIVKIHNEDDFFDHNYGKLCNEKCNFHKFLSAIGSDGKMYLCDHNTLKEGISYGNLLNESLYDIVCKVYNDSNYNKVCNCVSTVCPPLAFKINKFY